MHDFCFTIPYGIVLVCGGILGYASKGSTASLAGGVGTGLLLIQAGYLSLSAFGKRKNSYLALILETGTTHVASSELVGMTKKFA
ncbi:Protein FATTY ACID EXPORT 5, variant 3 [Sarracenia purpurea var. burkii]